MKQPTASDILVEMTTGDSPLFSGFDLEFISWRGESADFEMDAGMLEDAIAPMFQPRRVGKFFLYGFRAFYSKDYEGEVDADYTLEGWREATENDIESFQKEEQNNG